MRLYRFINTDKKIDVVVVTDGSCEQKRVFITESPRGVVPAGSVNPSADEKAGSDAFLALGWKWNVGESVQHEELVAFAETNGLNLVIEPQRLNEVVAVNAEWNEDDACVISIITTVPAEKEVEIYFLNSVNLNESAGRFGVIRGDRKTLASKVSGREAMAFTLEDMGLDAKEDLNIVVMSDVGVQKFEVVAKNA